MSETLQEDPSYYHMLMRWWLYDHTLPHQLFVVVGEEDSGKARAVQQLFGSPTVVDYDGNPNLVLALEKCSPDQKQCILDVSPLKSSAHHEYNESLLASLDKHLKTKTLIPTLIIVERLDQDRFQGSSSEYRHRLGLIQQREFVRSVDASNIILLLTNADSPTIRDDLEQRKQAFREQFISVFSKEPLCCYSLTDEDLLTQLHKESNRDNFEFSAFHYQLFLFLEKRKADIELQAEDVNPLTEEKYILLETACVSQEPSEQQNSKIHTHLTISNSSTEETKFMEDTFTINHFDDIAARIFLTKVKNTYGYNLLSSDSKVLLYNGDTITVDKCGVGQRVKNSKGQISIVTNVVKFYWYLSFWPSSPFRHGRIYVCDQSNNNVETKGTQYIDKTATGDETESCYTGSKRPLFGIVYYYIEVNFGQGSFTVDDRDCFSCCEAPLSKICTENTELQNDTSINTACEEPVLQHQKPAARTNQIQDQENSTFNNQNQNTFTDDELQEQLSEASREEGTPPTPPKHAVDSSKDLGEDFETLEAGELSPQNII